MLREGAEQAGNGTTRMPRVVSTILVSDSLDQALHQEPALTVLVAPRGFGKTSAVAAWIRRQNQARIRYVWVALPMQPVTRAAFWGEVYRALTGADAPDGADALALVHAVLEDTLQPTALVVDNFTYVTDEGVDDELGDLVHRFERVHLVVMVRKERAIVALATAHSAGRVLRMAQMALGAEAVLQMATEAGFTMDTEQAQEIAHAVAGWPAAVQALLRDGTRDDSGALVPDWHAIERYCRIVLSDPDMQRFAPVLTALSAAEEFDDDLGQNLVGEDHWHTIFPVLLRAGVIDHWQHQGRDRYRLRPRLRAAVQAVMHRRDPQAYRRYHRQLADWYDHRDLAYPALTHAVQAEQWQQAAALVEDYWLEVVTERPEQAQQMLRAFPEEVVRASATLLVVRDYILNVDTGARAREAFRSGQMAVDFSARYENQRLTLSQTLQMRVSGQFEAFRQLVEESGDGAQRSAWADAVLAQMPELLLQWSITTLLTSDLVSAAYTFRQAYRWARERDMSGAQREAGSGLALCLAILGHLNLAEQWLEHIASLPAAGSAPADLERAARILVGEIVAGDRMHPTHGRERAEFDMVAALPGLDAVHQYITAAYALHGREPEARAAMLGALERTMLALTPGRHGARITGAVARSGIVDLCIATEQFERAHRALRDVDEDQAWVRVCRSRLALYEGRYETVLDLTANLEGISMADVRHGLQLHLLRASAALRLDRLDLAGDNLQEAVSLSQYSGIVRHFALVPRVDLVRLDREFAHVVPPQILDAVTARDEVFGAPREPVRLSERETEVLRQIATGVPLSRAARRLYVSENTIKSQVRNIYRKLGVHSREDAIARATALGLLPDAAGPPPVDGAYGSAATPW